MNEHHYQRIDKIELYGLFDPDTDELRYIGKADNSVKRLKTHLWDSRTAKRPVCQWIKGLVESGRTPRMQVLEVVDREEWEDAEKRLIALHRKTARLLNLADGGAMPSQTKEQRIKAAKASNKVQSESPMYAYNRAKMEMGKLYKQYCKKPDIHAYTLRLLMKCYAAYRPDLHKSWLTLP